MVFFSSTIIYSFKACKIEALNCPWYFFHDLLMYFSKKTNKKKILCTVNNYVMISKSEKQKCQTGN